MDSVAAGGRYHYMLVIAKAIGERLRTSKFTAPLALCAIGALLYGGTVGHEFTTWDDDVYITRNPVVTNPSWEAVVAACVRPAFYNYHPLTVLSYMLEYALVGEAPWLYHLDNVILHLGATVLCFWLCRRWLGSQASRGPAFVTALLFLAHPLRVESVAWVAERKDVLCGLFYLAALLAYTRHLDAPGGQARKWWGLSLLWFGLALTSKVMAITLPAVLVLLLVARRQATRSRLLALIPFAMLSLVFAVIGIMAQAEGGGVKELHGGTLTTHVLSIFKAASIYAEKLLLPIHLSPRYLVTPALSILEPRVISGVLVALVSAWAAWKSYHGDRHVLLGLGFFALVWAPVSGIAPSSTLVADRYLYLPALGLFFLVGRLMSPTATPAVGLAWRRVALGLVACHIVSCLLLTPTRAEAWQNSTSLWTAALEENPANPFAYNQLSIASLEAGRPGEAAVLAAQAGRHGLGGVEYALNLAFAYRAMGDREREGNTARSIVEAYPDCLGAWLVILRHHIDAAEFDQSNELVQRLALRHGEDPALVAAVARLEEKQGNLQAALGLVLRAIELQPRQADTLMAASVLLARLGDSERAIANAERAMALPGAKLHPGALESIAALVMVFRQQEPNQPELRQALLRVQALARDARLE